MAVTGGKPLPKLPFIDGIQKYVEAQKATGNLLARHPAHTWLVCAGDCLANAAQWMKLTKDP